MTVEIVSFDAWYKRESSTVFKAVSLALADVDLAEEATAEAFARAWASWERVQAMVSPVGWVYRVALNLAKSRWRRDRLRRAWTAARVVPGPEAPDDEVWRAVAGLTPRARLAVSLRYIADLPELEIARVMGVARGTVAATLHNARTQLALELANTQEVPW